MCCVVGCQVETTAPKEWVSFLKPNLTISMVDHFATYPKTNIPPPVSVTASNASARALCLALPCTGTHACPATPASRPQAAHCNVARCLGCWPGVQLRTRHRCALGGTHLARPYSVRPVAPPTLKACLLVTVCTACAACTYGSARLHSSLCLHRCVAATVLLLSWPPPCPPLLLLLCRSTST